MLARNDESSVLVDNLNISSLSRDISIRCLSQIHVRRPDVLCFCRFTKEDIQSMDFGAYLASSSSDESDIEGEEQSGRGQEAAVNDIDKYKVMIVLQLAV